MTAVLLCLQTSEILVGQSSPLVLAPHVSFGGVRSAISDLKEALQQVYHQHFPDIAAAGGFHPSRLAAAVVR